MKRRQISLDEYNVKVRSRLVSSIEAFCYVMRFFSDTYLFIFVAVSYQTIFVDDHDDDDDDDDKNTIFQ
jgi:hypothetical protein